MNPYTVPIAAIDVSVTNPRKHFDQAKLDELAASILEHGVIQPVLLRPKGDRYELVAGERRFRASRQAGLEEIPAVVRDLDDRQALEMQVIENLQRTDLNPLEEAEGYASLIRMHGYDADTLASKIKKSRSYIYSRMKLADLTEGCKDALANDDLHHSTALLLARLPADLQDAALGDILHQYGEPMSFRQAKSFLEEEIYLQLAGVPWKLDDEKLVPAAGSCTACPFRTGNQKDLFGDVKKSADACTQPSCYKAKGDAVWVLAKDKAEKGGARVLTEAETEKAFHSHGGVKRDGPFVAAAGTCHDDPKGRTYSAIVGKALKPVIGRDPRGGAVVSLYARSELAAAIKAAGISPAAAARVSGENSWQKQQRIEADKRKLDRSVERAIVGALLPKVEQLPFDSRTLKLFTRVIAVDRYYKLEDFLKRRGHKSVKWDAREKTITSLVDEMNEGQMLALLAEALLTFSPTEQRREADRQLPGELCDLVGVDWKAIEKGIREEATAKKKAKKAKEKKAAAPPAKKTPAAAAPAAKAKKKPAEKHESGPLPPLPPCGTCGKADRVRHSGWMHQETPDSPRLDPAVELLRCSGCKVFYRADGVAYDHAASVALWIAAREAKSA